MKPPRFVIVSTGSELTAGRSQDTNSSWIANELFGHGFSVEKFLVLPDSPELIERELCSLSKEGDRENPLVVVMTGGLGPTEDDYTLQVVCKLTDSSPVEDPTALDRLKAIYRLRGRLFEENLKTAIRQVSIPSKSEVLPNSVGIAPGFWVELSPGSHLACMPGVPKEMTAMFSSYLAPVLKNMFRSGELHSDFLFVWGMSESTFQQEFIQGISVLREGKAIWGVAAKRGFLRVTYQSANPEIVSELIRATRDKYGEICTGDVFEELPKLLLERKLTVGTAESCTGGLAAKLFTDRPGSSEYFLGAIVSYANEVKVRQLGVRKNTLETYGAVSRETAEEMAEGAAKALETDLAISITGIAGPSGGTPTKKIGTVFIGIHVRGKGTIVHELYFPFKRDLFRDATATTSLYLLYNRLRNDA